MRTLIKGGWVVGHEKGGHTLIRDGVVVFEGNTIRYVGKRFDGTADRTIDASKMLVSPGFIDTHVHAGHRALHRLFSDTGRPDFYGQPFLEVAVAREGRAVGMADRIDQATGLTPAERRNVEAEFTVAELLRNGITTFVEFGSLLPMQADLLRHVDALGIRAYLAGSIESGSWGVDASGHPFWKWDDASGRRQLEEALAFIKRADGSAEGRVKGIIVPGKVEGNSADLLRAAAKAAKELALPLAIHASYNIHEFYHIVRTHRMTPVEFLDSLGFLELGPKLNLGHCNFVGENALMNYPGANDVELIGRHGCTVSHCPVNLARRARFLDSWQKYRKAGINVALGTDTYPRDMVMQMRAASYFGKVISKSLFAATAQEVFNASTLAGAASLGRPDLGRLEAGAKADIVLVNLGIENAFRQVPMRDPIKALVECGLGDDVDTVIVDGVARVEKGRIPGLDVPALFRKVQTIADAMWDALPEWDPLHRTADEMGPFSFPVQR